MWNLQSNQEIVTLPTGAAQVDAIAADPSGSLLAVGDFNGQLSLYPSSYWRAGFGQLRTLLCARIQDNLSQSQWAEYVPGQRYQQLCPSNGS